MPLKGLLCWGLLLVAVPVARRAAAQPPPRCTTILLHTADSSAVAIRVLARQLLASGYALACLDKQAGYLLTRPHPLARAVTVVVQAIVTPTAGGSRIALNGTYRWGPSDAVDNAGNRGNSPIDYRAKGNKPARVAWDGLARAAVYPGSTVSYRK